MKKNKKLLGIASLLFVIIAFSSRCINNKTIADPRGTAFAPEQNCRQCHQAIYDSALSSAHFNASASATAKNVLGNFNAGHNAFVYDSVTSITYGTKGQRAVPGFVPARQARYCTSF